MKNIIIKKIIPFVSVFSIILSLFCFSASADGLDALRIDPSTYFDNSDSAHLDPSSLNWVPLQPGYGFTHFELYNTDVYKVQSKPTVGEHKNQYSYYYDFSTNSSSALKSFYNCFFNVNILSPGFTLKKGVNYYIVMLLCFPEKYGPNESEGCVWWPDDCTAGAYNWFSPGYSSNNSFTFEFTNETMNSLGPYIQNDEYQSKLPTCINSFTKDGDRRLSYMRYFCRIIPSKDTSLKSFGFNLSFTEAHSWDGIIGISGFCIGVPKEEVIFDNSGSIFGDYKGNGGHDGSGNNSSNTTSCNTSSNVTSNNGSGVVSPGSPTTSDGGSGGTGDPGNYPGFNGSVPGGTVGSGSIPNTSNVASNAFGSGIYSTVGGLEGGIGNANKGNVNKLNSVFNNFGNSLSGSNSLTKGLLVSSHFLNKMIKIPSFNSILYFSIALGFITISLNLVSSFASNFRSKGNKIKKSIKNKNKKGK